MLRSIFTGGLSFESVIIQLFSAMIVIFLCLPVHECAHGFAAKLLGDDTAEREGRLTINPFSHIDLFGAVAMALCGIGWAKPVPVNLSRCRKVSQRAANVIVSIAGPLANILMALIFIIAYKLISVGYMNSVMSSGNLSGFQTVSTIVGVFAYVARINALLAVFNLLPIPPFDGYRVLMSFLPARWVYAIESRAQIINMVMMILLISGILSIPIGWLSDAMYNLLDLMTRFIV